MGLNCGCPEGAHLADLEIADCKEGLGQVQKFVLQRIYKTVGEMNSIADPTKKASWTTLFAAADGTKTIISPYIQGPTTEPGAARTFGGGNQTLGGIEIIIGREPTTFSAVMYQEKQKTIATMKKYMCENVGVYLIDEGGNIAGISEDDTKIMPIPIGRFFVGDKNLGGFEEPDSNSVEWSFFPNWSDKLHIIKREELDFNPLTDLVNASSTSSGLG